MIFQSFNLIQMVTHEEDAARSVSHRVLRLLDGVLVDEAGEVSE